MYSNITATVVFVTLRKPKTIQLPEAAALTKIPLGRLLLKARGTFSFLAPFDKIIITVPAVVKIFVSMCICLKQVPE